MIYLFKARVIGTNVYDTINIVGKINDVTEIDMFDLSGLDMFDTEKFYIDLYLETAGYCTFYYKEGNSDIVTILLNDTKLRNYPAKNGEQAHNNILTQFNNYIRSKSINNILL